MAETYVKIAVEPEYARVTGQHFDKRGEPVGMPKYALYDEVCARLWEISAEMTSI